MRKILLVAVVGFASGALASEPAPPSLAESSPARQPDLTRMQAALNGAQPDSVAPSAIPGLYEIVLGGQVLYLSSDGRFVVQGDILDLDGRANLTDNRRGELRGRAIEAVGEDNMVIFAPEGPVKHTVTVFTDIDCGYCRRMHEQMPLYHKEGIKIRYLWFPREGIDSASFAKSVGVWCAADRRDAMTRAKRGEDIERKTCENPVQAQYELGQQLGVRGTPSLILESGEMLPGYVPPAQLAELLAARKAPQPATQP
jgi:thiol:disulfide interchange protein DsbC